MKDNENKRLTGFSKQQMKKIDMYEVLIEEGFNVSYSSIVSAVNKLDEKKRNLFDEFGYISSDKEGAELLFTNISIRTGLKSTIVTTNLSFDRWNQILGDPTMTTALTDRLTHKSYVINMNGSSYRLKETKAWLKNLNK